MIVGCLQHLWSLPTRCHCHPMNVTTKNISRHGQDIPWEGAGANSSPFENHRGKVRQKWVGEGVVLAYVTKRCEQKAGVRLGLREKWNLLLKYHQNIPSPFLIVASLARETRALGDQNQGSSQAPSLHVLALPQRRTLSAPYFSIDFQTPRARPNLGHRVTPGLEEGLIPRSGRRNRGAVAKG